MRDLPRCDPASGELSHRAVDVIGIENHDAGGQFVVGDFGENQSLHSDRPVDLAVIAKHQAVQHQARSPDGDPLHLLVPTRCRLEEQRAREVRLDQPLVTQPFSPVLISSVCSDNGKEAVKVAAVECIHHACENPGRGVLQVRRCDIELVEPCERGVEVCLVEDLAVVDQVAFEHQDGDLLPFGGETLFRSPAGRVGDDRTQVAQPMHSHDADVDVGRDVPCRTDIRNHVAGPE